MQLDSGEAGEVNPARDEIVEGDRAAGVGEAAHAIDRNLGKKPRRRGRRVDNRQRAGPIIREMCIRDRDNGVGFDPATTLPGRGTKLMKEIAQQLRGTLRLERLPIGMTLRLTFADSA